MKRHIPVLAVVLLLTGCAAAPPAPAETPAASPEPTYATENQVASVIATYEPDWREVIEASGECRSAWTFDPGSIPGATCWLREQTLTTTAEIVIRDLEELEIPPSMTSIVDSTTLVLQGIVDLDVKEVCGEGVADPLETPGCTEVVGSLNFYFLMLEKELDSLSPYL